MPEQIADSAAQAAYCQAVKRHSLAQLRQPDTAAAKKLSCTKQQVSFLSVHYYCVYFTAA